MSFINPQNDRHARKEPDDKGFFYVQPTLLRQGLAGKGARQPIDQVDLAGRIVAWVSTRSASKV